MSWRGLRPLVCLVANYSNNFYSRKVQREQWNSPPAAAPQVGEEQRPPQRSPSGHPSCSPASPFLLHYKIPPREGASFSFNLVIGKKNKMEDLESAVIIVFIPLWKVCCPLSMNNPKAKWFYLYFSCTPLPFPPPGCAVIIEQLYHWDYWC